MSERKKKTITISLFLHKNGIEDFQDCITEDAKNSSVSYDIKQEIGLSGKIYVHVPTNTPPHWNVLLNDLTNKTITVSDNVSNKAVVIFEYKTRYLSIAFGYGSSMLDDTTIVRNFGLKAAANLISPEKIRSLNSMTIEDTIVDTQKQASENIRQEQFQTNENREILKSVSGSPSNESVAKFMVGTDSLKVTRKMNFEEIKENLIYYFNAYNKDDYKNNGFAWIDNIQKIKDVHLKESLNAELVSEIYEEEKNNNNISIVPNKIIDWGNITAFYLKGMGNGQKDKATIDIDYHEYFEYIKRKQPKHVIDKLKKDGVIAITDSDEEIKISNVYDAIIYETIIENVKYILCYGDWYEINKDFYSQVVSRIKKANKSNIIFPTCDFKQDEGEYNLELANENDSFVLMDMKNYVGANYGRSKIEPCDVFTKNNQFIHIKKNHSSSQLSHLFAQGTVSARILANDSGLKKHINKIASKKFGHKPIKEGNQNHNFEIIFAIIDKREKNIEEILPFFSMVNLAQTLDSFDAMNYKSSLAVIKQELE